MLLSESGRELTEAEQLERERLKAEQRAAAEKENRESARIDKLSNTALAREINVARKGFAVPVATKFGPIPTNPLGYCYTTALLALLFRSYRAGIGLRRGNDPYCLCNSKKTPKRTRVRTKA